MRGVACVTSLLAGWLACALASLLAFHFLTYLPTTSQAERAAAMHSLVAVHKKTWDEKQKAAKRR